MYKIVNIKSIEDLTKKDWYYINLATEVAKNSKFETCKRLGAVLIGKGKCVFQR